MKMLVTGGAGFIGTNLIKRLLKDGHEVVSIDNYSTGKKENEQDGCIYYDYDLSYSYVRDDGDSYDVIFHLAALPRIQPSFENPLATFNANVLSTLHILEYARKKNEKVGIVYADSSSVHGNKYVNPYTYTKYNASELCKMYSEIYKVSTNICRFYNVYGPHQETEGEYCTVVGIFERQYKNSEPLTITGDGEQRRDFTHVDDIVDGLVRASWDWNNGDGDKTTRCWRDLGKCEEFEFGSGKNYSMNELANMFGEDYPCDSLPKREGEMRETLCTDTKASEVLDWNPTINLTDYIDRIK